MTVTKLHDPKWIEKKYEQHRRAGFRELILSMWSALESQLY